MSNRLTGLQLHYVKRGALGVPMVILNHAVHKLTYLYNKNRVVPVQRLPRVTRVDVNDISYSTIPEPYFPNHGDDAFVGELGGMWDLFKKGFEKTVLYNSLYNRFKNGYQWQETKMYQSALWSIQNNKSHWNNSQSESDLLERCEHLDRLYENIKNNGYVCRDQGIKLSKERTETGKIENGIKVGDYIVPDEVRVGIDRHGQYVRLGGGRHRTIIAKLAGIDRIPAVVLVEHTSQNMANILYN